MTERQFQTLMWALALLPFALMAVLILTGCKAQLPTASTAIDSREHRMVEFLQCYADHHGLEGHVTLRLFDDQRAHCGEDSKCGVVICAAWPGSMAVECWRPWINGQTQYPSDDSEFSGAASHEVCHLTGIWDERETSLCAVKAREEAGC